MGNQQNMSCVAMGSTIHQRDIRLLRPGRKTSRGAAAIRLRQNRMAHASECLSQIGSSGLRYVEQPVTIEYTAYSLAKGQSIRDAVLILLDLFARRLYR